MIQSGETLFDFHISNKQVNLTNWGWVGFWNWVRVMMGLGLNFELWLGVGVEDQINYGNCLIFSSGFNISFILNKDNLIKCTVPGLKLNFTKLNSDRYYSLSACIREAYVADIDIEGELK